MTVLRRTASIVCLGTALAGCARARAIPKVEVGPWPGINVMSSPSGNSFSRILAISSS